MNKFSLPIALLALIISIGGFFYFQSTSNQVYVDVNKLLEGYKKTEIMRAEFKVKAENLNANVDSLLTNWQKELKSYEKDKVNMSKKELELKNEILGNKQQQINNYQKAVQQQIQEEDKKTTQTVINDINDYIKEYGKTHKYNIIFGASGSGNIMYAVDGADLTEDVLKGLNEEFGKN